MNPTCVQYRHNKRGIVGSYGHACSLTFAKLMPECSLYTLSIIMSTGYLYPPSHNDNIQYTPSLHH
jgi:hypothetical protein